MLRLARERDSGSLAQLSAIYADKRLTWGELGVMSFVIERGKTGVDELTTMGRDTEQQVQWMVDSLIEKGWLEAV